MNLNDVELNARCLKTRQLADHLGLLMRERKSGMLWVALKEIVKEAEAAQSRLLTMEFQNGTNNPYACQLQGCSCDSAGSDSGGVRS